MQGMKHILWPAVLLMATSTVGFARNINENFKFTKKPMETRDYDRHHGKYEDDRHCRRFDHDHDEWKDKEFDHDRKYWRKYDDDHDGRRKYEAERGGRRSDRNEWEEFDTGR